jgi:CRP-like cAMP-binding protein
MTLTRDRKADLLSAARLFDGVDAEGMDRIAEVAVEVEFPAEHVIARQGDIGTGFFVVVSGAVRVVRDGDVIARLGPGDFFGELSVLDGLPRLAQVIADGPTTCLALATWDFESVLLGEPRVTLAILRGVARRLRDLTEAQQH